MDKRHTASRQRNTDIFHLLIVVFLASLCYSNTLQVPFIFDDFSNIVENAAIRNVTTIGDLSGSRYIGFLTFALNYHLGGLHVFGYHCLNIIIHIINGIIFYGLIRLTLRTPLLQEFSDRTSDNGAFIAIAAAIIFITHPIQTQAVTYVVQRFTSLTTLFYLLALVLFAKTRLVLRPPGNSVQSLLAIKPLTFYLLSLVSTILAMKTKEISFTLPFIILLYELTFFTFIERRGKFASIRFSYFVPYLLTLLIIPLSRIEAVEGADPLGGTKVPFTRYEFMFTQCRVLMTYVRLLFLPVNQNMDYDYPIYGSFLEPEVFISFFILLMLFASALYLYRYRSRGSANILTGFGILWFFTTLSIESSLIPLKEVIWEHRLYLPSIGFCVVCASVLSCGLNGSGKGLLERHFNSATMRYFALGIVIVSLSLLTYRRNAVWQDEQILWEDVVSKSPYKSRSYNNLGYAYESRGLIDKAVEHYRRAIQLNPNNIEAYNNLGNAYVKRNQFDKAIEQFQAAIALKPNYPKANNNLGVAYAKRGMFDKAIERFQIAITAKPDYTSAQNNLGNAYYVKGQFDKAIEHFLIALELGSDAPLTHYRLANAYYKQGMIGEAVDHYKIVLKLRPGFPGAQEALRKALARKEHCR